MLQQSLEASSPLLGNRKKDMIVRSSWKCLTCNAPHTLRLGMGAETRQIFRTPCEECGEDLVVALCVDFQKIEHWVEPVENVEFIDEVAGAHIVNLHANYSVPASERNKDFAFPHLLQMQEHAKVAEANGSLIPVSCEELYTQKFMQRPFRRMDFAEEWKLLKTTWSLHRRGRYHLIVQRLKDASDIYYANEPLSTVQDWLWRFLLFFSQPEFEKPFRDLVDKVRPLIRSPEFKGFRDHYNELAPQRAERYFELMKSYFENFDQFGQVHFRVVRGLEIPDENMASSVNFPAVKMFYGNAFEAFASSIDILAYLGNLIGGRSFDQFEKMTLREYIRLDKPSRFGPLASVPEFDALCVERDNQLRNASHHGGTRFDAQTQRITYQAGKGGQGAAQEIGLARYLARCDRIFLQAMVLFRFEIMLTQIAPGLKRPI